MKNPTPQLVLEIDENQGLDYSVEPSVLAPRVLRYLLARKINIPKLLESVPKGGKLTFIAGTLYLTTNKNYNWFRVDLPVQKKTKTSRGKR